MVKKGDVVRVQDEDYVVKRVEIPEVVAVPLGEKKGEEVALPISQLGDGLERRKS